MPRETRERRQVHMRSRGPRSPPQRRAAGGPVGFSGPDAVAVRKVSGGAPAAAGSPLGPPRFGLHRRPRGAAGALAGFLPRKPLRRFP